MLVKAGHTLGTNPFFMYYFAFAGIHLAHLLIGAVLMGILTSVTRRPTPGRLRLIEATIVGVALIAIGSIKLRLICIHFMELGNAPLGLRQAAEGYFVVVLVALITVYLTV